jgi:hypothetical protein
MFYILIFIIVLYFLFFKPKEHYTEQKIATQLDEDRATKAAFKHFCKKKGYTWIDGSSELNWDCVHTRQTCLKDSIYPTLADKDPQYYEWRAEPNNQRCIIGNEGFRDFCEKEGLTYDTETGICKTNLKYCNSKGLPFCNGDCFIPPLQWLSEQVLGTTLGRTLSQVSVERGLAELGCRLDQERKDAEKRN